MSAEVRNFSLEFPYRCKSQLHQRRIIDLLDFVFRPIVPRRVGLEGTIKNSRLRGRLNSDRGDSAIFPHKRLGFGLLEQSSTARNEELRSMATHDVVGESIDSGRKCVVDCISERGYLMMVGQDLGWIEFRRDLSYP
jgi:hypothetical protein